MTLPLQNMDPETLPRAHESDVSLIRREFIVLTGSLFSAVILNQLLYWTLRVKDFDYLLAEERQVQPNCNVSPRHGWIYKTAPELNEETMLGLSPPSIRKYLKQLIDEGWIDERTHPTEKWDKTTQYRVNLRKVQEDLMAAGRSLPEVYLKAFASCLQDNTPIRDFQKTAETSMQRNFPSNENSNSSCTEDPHFSAEIPNVRNFSSNEKIFASKVRNFGSNEKSFASKQRIFASNTENSTENKNKDHTQRAREISQNPPIDPVERTEGVCESFEKSVLEEKQQSQSPYPQPSQKRPSLPVPEAMVHLWRKHVVQEVLEPTKKRSHLLESALQIHFQRDLKAWEAFCERVKNTPFLTGQGPNGWWISLDWVLREGNMLKVLEGNFDPPEAHAQKQSQLATTDRELQMRAILERIKDPVWREWCSQLAFPPPLPPGWLQTRIALFELEDIANARFMEFDGRVVVVEIEDQRCANRIQDLRLQLLPVIQATYADARAISPQLIEEAIPSETGGMVPSYPQPFTHNKGAIDE